MNHYFRDRALLDLAYQLNCTLKLPGCEGTTGEPAHSNQSKHGKGGSLKAHDCFFAAACRTCHIQIDQGNKMTREEKFDAWDRAHVRTMLELWERGLIQVTP
jgi:hypothetical protein